MPDFWVHILSERKLVEGVYELISEDGKSTVRATGAHLKPYNKPDSPLSSLIRSSQGSQTVSIYMYMYMLVMYYDINVNFVYFVFVQVDSDDTVPPPLQSDNYFDETIPPLPPPFQPHNNQPKPSSVGTDPSQIIDYSMPLPSSPNTSESLGTKLIEAAFLCCIWYSSVVQV